MKGLSKTTKINVLHLLVMATLSGGNNGKRRNADKKQQKKE